MDTNSTKSYKNTKKPRIYNISHTNSLNHCTIVPQRRIFLLSGTKNSQKNLIYKVLFETMLELFLFIFIAYLLFLITTV